MAVDAILRLRDAEPIIDNKAELLRALERTASQFDELIGYPFGTNDEAADNAKDGLPCSAADGEYTDADKEFLELFKKIAHEGTDDLSEFIDKIADEGNDIDEASIIYYINQLFSRWPPDLISIIEGVPPEIKSFFRFAPDIMGANGEAFVNRAIAPELPRLVALGGLIAARPNSSAPVSKTSLLQRGQVPLNAAPVTFNKSPGIVQKLLWQNTINVQEVYVRNFDQLVAFDNTSTLSGPDLDKLNEFRISNEAVQYVVAVGAEAGEGEPGLPPHAAGDPREAAPPVAPNGQPGGGAGPARFADPAFMEHDGHNHLPHANIGVKDVEFFNTILKVHKWIYDSVDEELGEDDFKLCVFKKRINYFNAEQNIAQSENDTVGRVVEYISRSFDDKSDNNQAANGEEEIITKFATIETDLFGNTFTSADEGGEPGRMAFELTVPDHGAEDEDGTFKLYTVKGQLGSGRDVKEDDIVKECKT